MQISALKVVKSGSIYSKEPRLCLSNDASNFPWQLSHSVKDSFQSLLHLSSWSAAQQAVQHTSWWHLSLGTEAPTPYFSAPLRLFLLQSLTRFLFFPCLPWTSFLISLTGSRNHGFGKRAIDNNWGNATATAGDKMTQLASAARQELQSSFRDRTKRIAKLGEMRMNTTKICTTVELTSKKIELWSSFSGRDSLVAGP